MLNWCKALAQVRASGKGLPITPWLHVPWEGAGSCFTFSALEKRWQSPFFLLLPRTRDVSGGLAEYPGRWFGYKLLLKPVQKE